MSINKRERSDFMETVVIPAISEELGEAAVEWIGINMNPEDVFDKDVLIGWAQANGFVHGEEEEEE